MRHLGMERREKLDPKTLLQRYQEERPGNTVHVVIEQLTLSSKIPLGHQRSAQGLIPPGAGFEQVDMAVDDSSRLMSRC